MASELAVKISLSLWENFAGNTEGFLEKCFRKSQEKLLKKQEEENAKGEMKTTMPGDGGLGGGYSGPY